MHTAHTQTSRLLLAAAVVFAIAGALVGMAMPAHADYMMPDVDKGVKDITTIVDATVERFDDKGVATLKIHRVLLGTQAPKTLRSARLSCGGTVQDHGVKQGKRYVFLLSETRLYEEQSYFEVQPDAKSVLLRPLYTEWFEFDSARKSSIVGVEGLVERIQRLKAGIRDWPLPE